MSRETINFYPRLVLEPCERLLEQPTTVEPEEDLTNPPQDRFVSWLERVATAMGAGLGVLLISVIRALVVAAIAYPLALAAAFYAKSLPRDVNVWSLAAIWSLWAATYHLGNFWAKHWPKYRDQLREQACR